LRDWQARHQLINKLAHEINNPLEALMFTVHLLDTHAGVTKDAHYLVEDGIEMVDRIAKSVRMVLMESRPVE